MAKHMVKCLYCEQMFDLGSEPFIKPRSNRYAHASCHEKHELNISQDEQEYMELIEYIRKLFKESFIAATVAKQIKEYRKEYGYTYTGMLKTLKWWYEIKKESTDKAHGGIAIIPHIYNQASEYYYAIHMAEVLNEDIEIKSPTMKIKEIIISPPVGKIRQPHLFNLDDDEEN